MTDHCLEESRGLSGGTPQGLPACPPPSAECLERSRGGLSLNHLKAVAVAAMVIDHIAFDFVPDGTLLAILLHSIGKIKMCIRDSLWAVLWSSPVLRGDLQAGDFRRRLLSRGLPGFHFLGNG